MSIIWATLLPDIVSVLSIFGTFLGFVLHTVSEIHTMHSTLCGINGVYKSKRA